jgi:hypothetical protein
MANTTNDYNYATTDTGAAIGNTVAKISKPAGGVFKIFNSAFDVRNDPNGLSISDFLDTDYNLISLAFKDAALDGTLLGAIWNQFALSGGGFNTTSWNPASTYLASTPEFVFYNTGSSVNIYKCILNISTPSAVTPDVDVTHWQYMSQAFKLRLIPDENSYVPDTSGGERFKHYVTCYVPFIDDVTFSPLWNIAFAAKSYSSVYTSNGLEDAVVTDGTTASNNMIVAGISSTWNSNAFTCTHPNTGYLKLITGTKVRVRGLTLGGVSIPFTVTVASSTTTGFTGTIASLGTYSSGTSYNYGDFVTYTTGGNTSVYYHYSASTTTGTVPTSTGTWKKVVGTISSGTADTIFSKWTLYLDTNFFQAAVEPVPAGSTSSSKAKPRHTINSFVYNEHIVNQKQTLFSTGDYIIHDGFPFDKDSITGGTMNITAGILPDAISSVARPPITTTYTGSLPQSDNRWISISGDVSGWAYPANTNLVWTSHNGSTSRNLQAFNDTSHTYLPELLDGFGTSNQSDTTNQLMLMSPDTSTPPMSAARSLSFANKDFLYTGFNPFKIDGSSSNAFTSLVVAYLDYVPGTVMSTTLGAEETNWYGIMSEAVFSASPTLATDVATLNTYTQYQPRLSVRYKYDGTITLNLGDTLLTGIKAKNGIARPFQPIIVGLTVEPPDANGVWTAKLTVVDTDINRTSVRFKRNWLGYSAQTHNVMLYGATPFNKRWHGAKMFVMEINHYYSSQTSQFFNNEIKTMDKMYAVTSGRVS